MDRDPGLSGTFPRAREPVGRLSDRLDLVVVGAGIVGLATARAHLDAHPGAGVTVLEKEDRIAAHQSGRNSGVIHSGIYYRPGSEKARLCQEGRTRLLAYCRDRAIPHEVCGKVVVATDASEAGRLSALHQRTRDNGIETSLLSRRDLLAIEPHADGIAALHVPGTGVVDFGAVCDTLAADIRAAGGTIELSRSIGALQREAGGVRIEGAETMWRARTAVNCAGLHADELARSSGAPGPGTIVPFRGEYHVLRPERDFLVRHLIYPVPDPRFPFLGVHLTRGVDGRVHTGPNAVLAFGREAYSWGVIDPVELLALAGDRRLWRLATRYWWTGAGEIARSLSRSRLTRALRRLVPEIDASDLTPAPAGVRAQLVGAGGDLVDDFVFSFDPPIVHVLNAPSPAATASLAIATRIVAELDARRPPSVG